MLGKGHLVPAVQVDIVDKMTQGYSSTTDNKLILISFEQRSVRYHLLHIQEFFSQNCILSPLVKHECLFDEIRNK